MSTIDPVRGIVQDGKVVFTSGQFPEGTPVVVSPVATPLVTDDDGTPESPEAIAAWLRWYDALEPVELTDAERAAWEAARREQKELEKAQWEARSQRMEGRFS